MGKKQRKMETDPKVQTGRMKPKEETEKPGIKVDIDGMNLGKWGVDLDAAVKAMADQIGASFLTGKPPGERTAPAEGSGRIFIDGMGEFTKQYGPGAFNVGAFGNILEQKWEVDSVEFRDAVAAMLLRKATDVWTHPINWTFGVGYNAGQRTFWFTARYHDDEGTMLVEETTEVEEETMAERNWDESCLILEGELEKMNSRCEAEIAMFEEDE